MNNFIKVKLISYSKNAIFEKLQLNDISFYECEIIDDYSIRVKIKYKNLKKIKKAKISYTIEKEYGFLNIINFSKVKIWTIICLIFSSFFFLYLNNLVMDVRINGQSDKLNEEILNVIINNGIRKYKSKPTPTKIKEVERIIINKYINEISIISITTSGSVVNVSYQKKNAKEIMEQVHDKMYSKFEGIIEKIDISIGNVLVEVNQYVRVGDLLVDDTINDTYIGTKGKIYGERFLTVSSLVKNRKESEVEIFQELQDENRFNAIKNFFDEEDRIVEEKNLEFYYSYELSHLTTHYVLYQNFILY